MLWGSKGKELFDNVTFMKNTAKVKPPSPLLALKAYGYVLKMLINYEKLQKRPLILDNLLRLSK